MSKESIRIENAKLVAEYSKLAFSEKIFVVGETVIPHSGKKIGVKKLQNGVESSLDGWLATGRFNKAFEKKTS